MAQTLKSKISQMTNAYSINAIIETARQVQKENSTQMNVLDYEVSLKLQDLNKKIASVADELEHEVKTGDPDLRKVFRLTAAAIHYSHQTLIEITDRVTFTREGEKK